MLVLGCFDVAGGGDDEDPMAMVLADDAWAGIREGVTGLNIWE